MTPKTISQSVPMSHKTSARVAPAAVREGTVIKQTDRAERQNAHTILTLWGGVTAEANDIDVETLTLEQLRDIALEAWNLSASILSRNRQ
jgi:hypothetical protein